MAPTERLDQGIAHLEKREAEDKNKVFTSSCLCFGSSVVSPFLCFHDSTKEPRKRRERRERRRGETQASRMRMCGQFRMQLTDAAEKT